MGDKTERAVIGIQGIGQHFPGIDIQMVGRLIHQQKIGRTHQHLGDGKPAFLSAGKDRYLFKSIIAAEKKSSQKPA